MPSETITLTDSSDDEPTRTAPRRPPPAPPRPSQAAPPPARPPVSQSSQAQGQRAPLKVGPWASTSTTTPRASASQGAGAASGSSGRVNLAGSGHGSKAALTSSEDGGKGKGKAQVIDLLSTDDEAGQSAEDSDDLPALDEIVRLFTFPFLEQSAHSSPQLNPSQAKRPGPLPPSARQPSTQGKAPTRNVQRDSSPVSDELSIVQDPPRRASSAGLSQRQPRKAPRPSLPTVTSSHFQTPQSTSSSARASKPVLKTDDTPKASTSQLPRPNPLAAKPPPTARNLFPSSNQSPPDPTSSRLASAAPGSSSRRSPAARRSYLSESDSDFSIEIVPSNRQQQPSGARSPVEAVPSAGQPSNASHTAAQPARAASREHPAKAISPRQASPAAEADPAPHPSAPTAEAEAAAAAPTQNAGHSALKEDQPAAPAAEKQGPEQGEATADPVKEDGDDAGFAGDEESDEDLQDREQLEGFASSASRSPAAPSPAAAPAQALKGQPEQPAITFDGFASSGDEEGEDEEPIADSEVEQTSALRRGGAAAGRMVVPDSEEDDDSDDAVAAAPRTARKSQGGRHVPCAAGAGQPVGARAATQESATALAAPVIEARESIDPSRRPSASSRTAATSRPAPLRARKSTGTYQPTASSSETASPSGALAPSRKRRGLSPASPHVSDSSGAGKKPQKRRRGAQASASADGTSSQTLPSAFADEAVDTPEEVEKREKEFKNEQRLLPPSHRQFAGPSYHWRDEFDTSIHDLVNHKEKDWKKGYIDEPLRDGYAQLFSNMVNEANTKEYGASHPFLPTIRVVPARDAPRTAWSSPPFEFIYTNRVVYRDGIVPRQAPGCGCDGDCSSPSNRTTCSCLKRQIAASRTRPGEGNGTRSEIQDFAWSKEGRLQDAPLEHGDLIIECNSQCGCGPACQNRVVGQRSGISVDIFWTGIKGWAVRLPTTWQETVTDQDGHETVVRRYNAKTVKKGQPLAIYSGELMTTEEAYAREDCVYNNIERSYTYDLDAWTIGEELEARGASLPDPPGSEGALPASRTSKSQNVKPVEKEGKVEEETSTVKTPYAVDAFCVGNWTRFANHLCQDFNAIARPVYIDDHDVTRPLWVYIALKDIRPGEEIAISYFSRQDASTDFRDSGMTKAKWQAGADRERTEAPEGHRCYCGKEYCRGRMFRLIDANKPMFFERAA
ncbi:hypothetical protein JCM6882_003286 [Rhodosporidiobolus microsporus]